MPGFLDSHGPRFGWQARIAEEIALRRPRCPECKMRTFHTPECSHSELTDEQRERARARRSRIERFFS